MDGLGRRRRVGLRRDEASERQGRGSSGGRSGAGGGARSSGTSIEETVNDKYIFVFKILTLPTTEQKGFLKSMIPWTQAEETEEMAAESGRRGVGGGSS